MTGFVTLSPTSSATAGETEHAAATANTPARCFRLRPRRSPPGRRGPPDRRHPVKHTRKVSRDTPFNRPDCRLPRLSMREGAHPEVLRGTARSHGGDARAATVAGTGEPREPSAGGALSRPLFRVFERPQRDSTPTRPRTAPKPCSAIENGGASPPIGDSWRSAHPVRWLVTETPRLRFPQFRTERRFTLFPDCSNERAWIASIPGGSGYPEYGMWAEEAASRRREDAIPTSGYSRFRRELVGVRFRFFCLQ